MRGRVNFGTLLLAKIRTKISPSLTISSFTVFTEQVSQSQDRVFSAIAFFYSVSFLFADVTLFATRGFSLHLHALIDFSCSFCCYIIQQLNVNATLYISIVYRKLSPSLSHVCLLASNDRWNFPEVIDRLMISAVMLSTHRTTAAKVGSFYELIKNAISY